MAQPIWLTLLMGFQNLQVGCVIPTTAGGEAVLPKTADTQLALETYGGAVPYVFCSGGTTESPDFRSIAKIIRQWLQSLHL